MALAQAMDVVANNIANASTTGFKREGIAFDTLLYQNGTTVKTPTSFVYDRATYRDVSNGPIENTGNPLDLAIQGQGYFKVQMPDGTFGYTRAGSLQLNTDGILVTQAGLHIVGDGGDITIPNTASQLNVASDGFVSARVDNGAALAQIGKINLVAFPDDQKMQAIGNGVYTTTQLEQPVPGSSIKEGAIEQSNVQPVTEITDMIRIMRSYEQASTMISNENQRQSDAVTRLAKTTSAG
jgi:flagellar basal-body rod protein FlgF